MSVFLWIGCVASPEDFEKQIQLGNDQVAANKTQLKFIKGIEYNLEMTFDIISGHLVTNLIPTSQEVSCIPIQTLVLMMYH